MDLRHISDADWRSRWRGADDDVADFIRRPRLAADQAQYELMILLYHAGRVDHVAAADGVENIRDGNPGLHELGWVRLHFEFRHLAALHHDRRNAGLAIEARLDIVGGHFPERSLGDGVRRQAVAQDRERGEGQTVGGELRMWAAARLHTRQSRVDQLQRAVHVGIPVEEQVDFGGAAAGDGEQMVEARGRH